MRMAGKREFIQTGFKKFTRVVLAHAVPVQCISHPFTFLSLRVDHVVGCLVIFSQNCHFFYFQEVEDRLSFIIKSTKLLSLCVSSPTAYILTEKLTVFFHLLLLDDEIVTI